MFFPGFIPRTLVAIRSFSDRARHPGRMSSLQEGVLMWLPGWLPGSPVAETGSCLQGPQDSRFHFQENKGSPNDQWGCRVPKQGGGRLLSPKRPLTALTHLPSFSWPMKYEGPKILFFHFLQMRKPGDLGRSLKNHLVLHKGSHLNQRFAK